MTSNVMLSINNPIVPLKPLYCNTNRLMNKCRSSIGKLSPKRNSGLNNSCSEIFMSNRSMKIVTQENEIKNLKRHIENLSIENKTIRSQNYLQQRDSENKQSQDLNLNNIFKQHEADIFNLKEQVRRARSSLAREQKLRTEREMEAFELRTTLYKKENIITENKLLEKFDVKKLLDNTQETLESKQLELEAARRQLENQDKNYKVELSNFQKQVKLTNERCEELEARVSFLNVSLKEKQRQLDIQNIYSNRINLGKLSSKSDDKRYVNNQTKYHSEFSRVRNVFPNNSLSDLPKIDESEHTIKQTIENFGQKKLNLSEIEKQQSTMIDDIRKIIAEEINLGKFAFVNNQIVYKNEFRAFSPSKVLGEDLDINSPFINDENLQPDYRKILDKPIGQCQTPIIIADKSNLALNGPVCLDKIVSNKKTPVINLEKSQIQISGFNSKLANKTITETVAEVEDVKSNDITYQHPDNNAVVENDSWLKDIETIYVADTNVDESKHKASKKEDTSLVMNNGTRNSNPIKSLFKFSQPIIDDLKDKRTLIDDDLKSKSVDSTLHRAVIGNGTLKNSLQHYLYLKQTNNIERKLGQ